MLDSAPTLVPESPELIGVLLLQLPREPILLGDERGLFGGARLADLLVELAPDPERGARLESPRGGGKEIGLSGEVERHIRGRNALPVRPQRHRRDPPAESPRRGRAAFEAARNSSRYAGVSNHSALQGFPGPGAPLLIQRAADAAPIARFGLPAAAQRLRRLGGSVPSGGLGVGGAGGAVAASCSRTFLSTPERSAASDRYSSR